MADEAHLAILLQQGVTAWNNWRKNNPSIYPDLIGANFSRARLDRANLSGALLQNAFFGKCELTDVDFTSALIDGARFHRCFLQRALFNKASGANCSFFGSNISDGQFDDSRFPFAFFDDGILEGASLKKADLSYSSCRRTDFRRADLVGANLTCASLVNADFQGALLEDCLVFGVSVWNAKLDGASQLGLVITPEHESSRITVDSLEVAQFIYLILNNRRLRDVIGTIGRKAVLILGSFEEGKEILDSIANSLRERDLLPIIFDFPKPEERDFTETIKILAGISRFVIAEISNPRSVPLELPATVPDYMIPYVPIIKRGKLPFSMLTDLQTKYHWVLSLVEYDDKESLLQTLDEKIIKPAMTKHAELVAKRRGT